MAMLSPKRTKYRKQFRGRMRGAAVTGSSVNAGEVGLKAIEPGWITARQIESARVSPSLATSERGGQVWVRVFPDKSVSKKPAETRMGGGKAARGLLGRRGQAGPRHVRSGRRALRTRPSRPSGSHHRSYRLRPRRYSGTGWQLPPATPPSRRGNACALRRMNYANPRSSENSATTNSHEELEKAGRELDEPQVPGCNQSAPQLQRAGSQCRKTIARLRTVIRERQLLA